MTEQDVLIHVYESDIFNRWHWYKFHFEQHLRGGSHPFTQSILRACVDCEQKIPGMATGMIDELAAISGNENCLQHYQQTPPEIGRVTHYPSGLEPLMEF